MNMASLRGIYKKKTAGFGNVEEKRIIRAVKELSIRRIRRSAEYANNRKIVESVTPSSSSSPVGAKDVNQGQPNAQDNKTEDRRTRLLKWKAERELQKKIAMQKKLPAFRTGIMHHKLNSPTFLHQACPAVKSTKPVTPRITRATAKRIAAKKNSAVKEKLVPTQPNKPSKNTKMSARTKTLETSFAPKNHQFKAPEGLPVLQLFGPEALVEDKTEPGPLPVYFSPYVVSARGKKASRKEQLQNIELGDCALTETETKETDGQSSGTSEQKEQLTTSHFRKMTEKEVKRLRALCQHWLEIKTDDTIPEEAQLLINQAIGQTNLLINKKIEQFKKLILECETGCGDQLVTCQDLQGFWEMMYMQVEDCDSRFGKLIKLQERNWQEEEPTIVKKAVAAKKPAASKKIIPSKSSSVRDMIRARRKQMESQQNGTTNSPTPIVGEPSNNGASVEASRLSAVKFDGGFFTVESPKKNVTPRSVRRTPLSQRSATSDEAKRRRSALSLIRISQLLKPPENKPVTVETDSTIVYVNSEQTPCKSILKRTDVQETASAIKKSQNKVIFSEKQKTPRNGVSWFSESCNIMSDARDEDVEPVIDLNIKKRLDLSDSDLEVEDTEDQLEKESETSCDQQVNLLDKKTSSKHRNVDDTTLSNSITNHTKPDEPPSSAPLKEESTNSVRTTRRTRQGVLNKRSEENDPESSNSQVTELNSRHTKENFMTNGHQKENKQPGSPEVPKRRRSTRKSVRFTGEECTACSEVKPVLPMTPRVRRRSSKSQQIQDSDGGSSQNRKVRTPSRTPSTQTSEDLISWDTPKEAPARVRRSLRLQNVKV